MRATFAGLNTMVRGIMANQLGLDTTGHNITNAGTEGYTRQMVNLATTRGEERAGLTGNVMIGTGVDALSVKRARNVYADIQYRNENPSQKYYETMAVNYDKLETIFDDSKNLGIEASLNKFYQTWVDLSTNASNSSARTQVIEQGKNLSDIIQTATAELQEQIRSEYEDLKSELLQVDDILEEIVQFNKQIVAQEVTGATANDLRDRRDLLVDQLSNYMNVSFTENEFGAYQINSGGVTLVNGTGRSHLLMSDGVSSSLYGIDYGVTDYNIKIKESNIVFTPQNGILKARLDSIAEDKSYIDSLADMASFMLTAFNDQHKQGWDMNGDYKFVDEDGNDVTSSTTESDLTAVEFMKADGTYLTATEADSVTLTEGVYMLGTEEVIKITGGAVYRNSADEIIKKVPDTINFFGKESITYEYRYDAEYDRNYLYKYDPDEVDSKNLLSGVQIIAALEVNAKLSEIHGDRYIAAATSKQYVETSTGQGFWEDMEWGSRTGDGTNAVYLSELFNISQKTIIEDNKANALVSKSMVIRDLDGNKILDSNGDEQYSTAMTTLSLNSYYQKSMSTLGIDAYSTDVNYEAMQTIMTQVENWRDSMGGVDWNEELTNMIKYQKGFTACSRCLNAMDECLDRLVNSTGVVGR
ncbi:MAG: flagellar hook-associated protein FlgK [Selenomonadaceae bacterium]|nr:flagellar hook-associated protein FlgK [Selenomonadaceae bacterium]